MTEVRGRGRAGLLSCSCDFDLPDDLAPGLRPAPLALVAAGFSFSVLAQALAFAALPIAGAILEPARAAAPVALMLAGAAIATFPAAFLTGLFGRRSSFALGASLGVAGAAIGAWGIVSGQFAGLCLGAFWLGAAQGFGLFYRHAVGGGGRSIALVLGSASLAAFAAPAAVRIAQAALGPLAPAGALIGAGLAQLCVLALAAPLPSAIELSEGDAAGNFDAPGFVAITAAAALAWFGMMLLMTGAPLAMASCGLGLGAASSAIAWHVLAMYAPAALVGASGARPPAMATTFLGMALLTAACVSARLQTSAAGFDLALIVGGCGWSLATLGATQWIHAQGAPPRFFLGLHDFVLFAAAVGGALTATALA